MRKFFLLLAFLAIPLSASGKVIDYIAAVVNGEPILYSDVVKAAKENKTSNLRETLDRLIEREILITEAEKEGIKVSDKEVQRALKELM
ncbi:SurA N-terminal domain-containing protein [Thermovibrio sp.]